MDKVILHCDLNGFYASVECILNPELLDVPMAVAGDPSSRHGIILAKNELAKKYNVQTAETIWQAKKKCPDIIFVPPNREEYLKYSRLVNNIYEGFTDLVEPFGIDESWLDVTGVQHLFGDGKEIADKIRNEVKEKLGLTISVGVSFNKIFAKLGSDYKKPDATTVISYENFREIVFPLPVAALLYVGKSAKLTLEKLGIKTIGELAKSEKALIKSSLGKVGEMIWDYANGLDISPVHSIDDKQGVKSIGNGMTFKQNLVDISDIVLGVNALSEEVAYRIRKHGVKCTTVSVVIKDPDFKSISRQKALKTPTHLAYDIGEVAMELISASWNLNAPIRMLSITGSNLVDENYSVEQISLFHDENLENRHKHERLEMAIDKIRDKYGKNSISRVGNFKNNLVIDDYKKNE